MAWDFVADSEKQNELSKNLLDSIDRYNSQVDNMYGAITELGGAWKGSDYDMFLEGTKGYETALNDLAESIKIYSDHFAKMAEGTETLATELVDIAKNITGSGYGGGAATTPTISTSVNTAAGGATGGTTGGTTGTGGGTTGTGTGTQTGNQGTGGTTGTQGTGGQTGNQGSGGTGTTGGTGTQPGNQGAGGTGTAAANTGTGTGAGAGTISGTVASGSEYFIQRGDKCTVDGRNVSFYGRDGSYNYYLDENGMVCVEENGRLYDLVNENSFNINYLKDLDGGWYGAVSSSNADAAQMGLPESSGITPSDASYAEYGMSEFVKYGDVDESQAVYPTINESFSDAVNQHQPVIKVAHDVDVPWVHGSDIEVDDTGYVTLIFDERSGKYYRLESDGTYERNMYGYDPKELSGWSIE